MTNKELSMAERNRKKNSMICPKCGGDQAYKVRSESHYTKVQCPQCGYAGWLKHYRAELKASQAVKKPCEFCGATFKVLTLDGKPDVIECSCRQKYL